ncbi:oxygenase MpaB family protein [Tsukamurella strandjordii]
MHDRDMAVVDQLLTRSRRARRQPQTLADLLTMVGLTSGVANIIMQLSLPPVGHGVHESRVESGSPRRHPFKRLRTTGQHLVVSVAGDEQDRAAFRAEMAKVHAHVHSTEKSPVKYSGNSRELQLWVAACLYRFYIDQYEFLYGPLDRETLDVLTPAAAPLATGVNVPESAWPQSWQEFEDYWNSMLPSLAIAPEVRDDLKSLSDFMFLNEALGPPGWVLAKIFGPLNHFMTRGNLPPAFREMLGWGWTDTEQEWFDRLLRLLRLADVVNPQALTLYNKLMLWDLRLRLRVTGSILGREKILDEPLGEQGKTPIDRWRERR